VPGFKLANTSPHLNLFEQKNNANLKAGVVVQQRREDWLIFTKNSDFICFFSEAQVIINENDWITQDECRKQSHCTLQLEL
jgi:hypothetical protein